MFPEIKIMAIGYTDPYICYFPCCFSTHLIWYYSNIILLSSRAMCTCYYLHNTLFHLIPLSVLRIEILFVIHRSIEANDKSSWLQCSLSSRSDSPSDWVSENSAVEDSPRLLVHFMIEPHYQLVIISLFSVLLLLWSYHVSGDQDHGDWIYRSLHLLFPLLFLYSPDLVL